MIIRGARDFLQLELSTLEQEVFHSLFLDNRHQIISFEKSLFCTIDVASAHPREVVKKALTHNAAAVILAHNHPSGVANALALVDIRVLDHLVIGEGKL